MDDGTGCCGCDHPLERVRYFPRQLMTAVDMSAEQAFFSDKLRRHNRLLHGWGVTCGLQVKLPTQAGAVPGGAVGGGAIGQGVTSPTQVIVCPGFAVSPQGDDILVDCQVTFDVATGAQTPDPCTVAWPCPPTGPMPGGTQPMTVYLAIRAAECQSRPVRLAPAGCGCDATACEYSRIRESFELKVLFKLPDSLAAALAADAEWEKSLVTWARTRENRGPMPLPPCPLCTDDPWVIIATVKLAQPVGTTTMQITSLTADNRRVLLSTEALQGILALA